MSKSLRTRTRLTGSDGRPEIQERRYAEVQDWSGECVLLVEKDISVAEPEVIDGWIRKTKLW